MMTEGPRTDWKWTREKKEEKKGKRKAKRTFQTLTPCIPFVEAREVSDSLKKKKKKCTHSVGDANPCGGSSVITVHWSVTTDSGMFPAVSTAQCWWESCHLWSQCTGPWRQTVGCYLLCLLHSADWESCHLWTNRKYHEDNLWLLFLLTNIPNIVSSHATWHICTMLPTSLLHTHTHTHTHTITHTHKHTQARMHTHKRAHTHTSVHARACVRTHTHTHTSTHACVHTHTHTHTHNCTCMHTHTHTLIIVHACTHTHTHAHTHTHTHTHTTKQGAEERWPERTQEQEWMREGG